jgi:membrane protein DedA with SNARE-associated domain
MPAAPIVRRGAAVACLTDGGAMNIHQLLSLNGAPFYLGVFVLTFLEGETIVLFAAVAAAQGLVDPVLLTVAASLGSFAGDQCYFWLGRQFGARLLDRFPRWRDGVDVALSWLQRYDTGFILAFRFIYGVRNISSFALGLSAVRAKRFLWLNFAAAGLWAASFVAVGYFLGHELRWVLADLARSFKLGMLAIFLIIAGGVALVHRLHRRRSPPLPRAADAATPPR